MPFELDILEGLFDLCSKGLTTLTECAPNPTLLSWHTCLFGIKVFPGLSVGIKTSGRQHQQIGGECRTSPLSQTDWGNWAVFFCVLHIGRLRVFGTPEESLGTIGRTQIPLLTSQGPLPSIPMPEKHRAQGAAHQSHLTQESSSHRGRGQYPLWGH